MVFPQDYYCAHSCILAHFDEYVVKTQRMMVAMLVAGYCYLRACMLAPRQEVPTTCMLAPKLQKRR